MNDCWELCFVPRVRLDKIHTHRHQHKHTQPLEVVPYYEVFLPKLPLVRRRANHQASVDLTPPGQSNQADVASVGQQQALPGGTDATQHVRLLRARTYSGTYKHTPSRILLHTHTKVKAAGFLFFSFKSIFLNIAFKFPIICSHLVFFLSSSCVTFK